MATLVLQLIAICALTASVVPVQQLSAVLTGRVSSSPGEALKGAQVRLRHAVSQDLYLETTSDQEGRFAFVGLRGGSYSIEVTVAGSTCLVGSPLEIASGQTREIRIFISSDVSIPEPCSSIISLEIDASWRTQFLEPSARRVPDTRTLWSILENQTPSLVTDALDIGGLQTGEPALFDALGSSWTENIYLLNGINVTDPYIPGRPLINPDFDSIAEFQVITASKPAVRAGSGVTLEIVTAAPTDDLHGSARGFYSARRLQSDNLRARIQRFGFPGPERVRQLVDANGQLSTRMPLSNMRWPFLFSFGTRHLSKRLGGFAEPIDAHLYNALARFASVSRGRQRLDLLYSIQRVSNDRHGAMTEVAPEATTRQTNTFHQLQGHWSKSFDGRAMLTASLGLVRADLSSEIQPQAEGVSTIDLPQFSRSGPAPLSFSGDRTSWEANGVYQTIHYGLIGSHNLSVSASFDRNPIVNRWRSPGGIELTLVNGIGSLVTRFETPAEARQRTTRLAFSLQDSWRPTTRLSLPIKMRIETVSGRGINADNRVRWTTIEPGAGLVASIVDDRLIMRAGWSRYGHILQGRYFDFGNPAALSGETFGWRDSNNDRQLQQDELRGLLTVFGGAHSAVDRDLARPFTDEITAGLDGSISWLKAGARFFRRDTHRQIGLENVGVPPTSYDIQEFLDPGNDGIPGNSDDQILLLSNRKSSELGKDFVVLTNLPGGRGSSKGFELYLRQRFGSADVTTSFTAIESRAPTNTGNSVLENDPGVIGTLAIDPNALILANSRTYFDRAYIGKVIGSYSAPRGFWFGTVIKYYDGLPFGRLLFVNGFNQGPFLVRATPRAQPGGFRTEFNLTLDLRVAREMQVKRGKLSAYVDLFNLLNMDLKTLEQSLTSPRFESRVPLSIQAPRLVRLGLMWRF